MCQSVKLVDNMTLQLVVSSSLFGVARVNPPLVFEVLNPDCQPERQTTNQLSYPFLYYIFDNYHLNLIFAQFVSLQAIKQFLEEVNCQRKDTTAGPIPWNTAVKFLMARKFDVKRAIDLFKAHEVRQTFNTIRVPTLP